MTSSLTENGPQACWCSRSSPAGRCCPAMMCISVQRATFKPPQSPTFQQSGRKRQGNGSKQWLQIDQAGSSASTPIPVQIQREAGAADGGGAAGASEQEPAEISEKAPARLPRSIGFAGVCWEPRPRLPPHLLEQRRRLLLRPGLGLLLCSHQPVDAPD